MVEYWPAIELKVPTRRTRGALAPAAAGARVNDSTGTIAAARNARTIVVR
jgi:hypothetical protein